MRPAGQNNTLTKAEAAARARFSGSHPRIDLLTLKTTFRIFKKPTILPLSRMKAAKGPGGKTAEFASAAHGNKKNGPPGQGHMVTEVHSPSGSVPSRSKHT